MVPLNACCLPDNSCGGFPDLSGLGAGFPGMAPPTPAGGGGGCLDLSPGTPDPSCPSQMVMGISLSGCCSKAGKCGVDLSIGGLGCNSLTALGGLGGLGGAPADAGPPPTCSAADGGASAHDAASASDASSEADANAGAD
jgi:hypothetical protein